MSFPLGRRRIGRYELLLPLASGGMATVFLGRLSGMAGFEKLVAIKVIHPHLVEQHGFVEMFLDEARLSARIHHPNVVEIFEVGEDEGLYFMVAELIRGRSLRDIMKAASRAGEYIEPRMYLTIVTQICDALHAAHTLKAPDGSPLCMVHRDVSPSNILVSFDGFVKLIDFGIAFAEGRITTTRTGVIKGKSGYLSPEQLTGDPVDMRSDIFSMGVVLYQVATGKHPFPGVTESERNNRLANMLPASPRSIIADIAPALERTIIKAIAKNPDDRHQTAEEMGQEIRSLLAAQGGLVRSMDIAGLMARLCAKEIIEDKDTLEQAMAMRLEPDNLSASRGDNASSQVDAVSSVDRRTVQLKKPSRSVVEAAKAVTPSSFQRTKKRRKRSRFVLAIGAGVAAALIVVFLNEGLFGGKAQDAPVLEPVSSVPQTEERQTDAQASLDAGINREAGGNRESKLAQPDTATLEMPNKGLPASDTAALGRKNTPTVKDKSVEIRLKGLPDSATVRLNGKNTELLDGKIAVPADGEKRELKVSAQGYLPYYQTIAPHEDGELTVKLIKKRAPQWTTVPNKERNTKTTRKKLMECPYCDQ